MSAAGVEGEVDFLVGVVPVEGVFHFVAVAPFDAVGFNRGDGDARGGEAVEVDMSLAEGFGDEEAFLF